MNSPLDWQLRAACQGMRTQIFFHDDYELPDWRAKQTCSTCPVKDECLTYALDHDEDGVWGGFTQEERKKINKIQHRVRCPDCRSDQVFNDGRSEVCLNCGLSWQV